MIRRSIVLLATLLSMLCLSAQQFSGQWTVYPLVGKSYEKVVDTPHKVYFLTESSLYSYDKDSDEVYFYSTANKLNSNDIRSIYYNRDGRYLIIVYADNNIDMLYDDGRLVALPDIKDANMTEDKTINDVAFGHGKIVVCTEFGLVIFDDKKHEVVESGIYRQPVKAAAVCGDKLIIYVPYTMYWSDINDRHNSLDRFKEFGGTFTDYMVDMGPDRLAWRDCNTNNMILSVLDYEKSERSGTDTNVSVTEDFVKLDDGFWFVSGSEVLVYDNNGEKKDSFTIPADLKTARFDFYDSKQSVWIGGPRGSANIDMSGSEPVILSDWYRPESTTCKNIDSFYLSPDGNRIYLSNLGPSVVKKYLPGVPDGVDIPQQTDMIENGKVSDVSILNASAKTSGAKNAQNKFNSTAMYGGVTRMAEDPQNSDTYYIGNGQEGVYVVKNREEIWKFDEDNAPFLSYWNTRVFDVNFDPQGNLWVAVARASTSDLDPYVMLPAKKLRQNFENIKIDDWQYVSISDFSRGTKDYASFFAKKSNNAFFRNADKRFYVRDTKGTYDNLRDDRTYRFSSVIDQDGNSKDLDYIYCFEEDKSGRVWVGTAQSLFYFNPGTIDENTTVIRPKVPRNDGTNYADYLLDSEQVTSIATDPSDRKWIATDMSGVYLVNENGTKIIRHFDTSNSPLPSNRVTAVICDPNSNTVYFGTQYGLISYRGDSSPAGEDFSEIYAYPNPVRPDFTGWVTISGLMDNSLVKIADSAGNVVYQTVSEGGMATWNVCNQSGERVRTGVYYVYASVGGDSMTANSAVTKIMVVN